jgi:hypothetical protein
MAIDWDAKVVGPLHKVFGNVSVTYIPVAGAPFTLAGIFDRGFRQVVVLEDGGEAVSSAQPVLGVQLSAMPVAPVQSDRFRIDTAAEASLQPFVGATYIVREVRGDSHGEARLVLNLMSRA